MITPNSVWIIEDETDLAETYSDFLKPRYETKVFNSAKEALRSFDTSDTLPSVIVSDIRLGEMNGLDFLSEIKKRNPSIPLVVVSGTSERDDLAKVFQLGIQGYFDKPFRIENLVTTIHRIIEEREVLENQKALTDELIRLYSRRYSEAENALFEANIPYPREETKCQYLGSIYRENEIHRQLSALEHRLPPRSGRA